jgi:1,4-dihydroxy-2-naphthoyl-CoA synthase
MVACTMAAATRDAKEGTEAFQQKRKPKFRGF